MAAVSVRSGAFLTELGGRVLDMAARGPVQLTIRDATEFVRLFAPTAHQTSPHTLCDRLNVALTAEEHTLTDHPLIREFAIMETIRRVLYEQTSSRRTQRRTVRLSDERSVVSEATAVRSTFSRVASYVPTRNHHQSG